MANDLHNNSSVSITSKLVLQSALNQIFIFDCLIQIRCICICLLYSIDLFCRNSETKKRSVCEVLSVLSEMKFYEVTI